jgi:hypothetical protein
MEVGVMSKLDRKQELELIIRALEDEYKEFCNHVTSIETHYTYVTPMLKKRCKELEVLIVYYRKELAGGER